MRWAKVILVLLFLVLLAFAGSHKVFAQSLEEKIREYQEQIARLQSQARTLSNQIAQFDAQISLTSAKIAQTETEIEELAIKIGQLEVSLEALSSAFSQRAVETYKTQRLGDPLIFLLSASDLNQLMLRLHYLRIIQEHDRSLLLRLQTAQTNFQTQKEEFEALQKRLEAQKTELARQKADKAYLLTVTKNDERRFQELLAAALAEQGAIKRAFQQAIDLLNQGQGEPISAGGFISNIGNSGYPNCSTGSHLHFTVLKDGSPQDPASYLVNTSITWNNAPDGPFSFSGSWDWPISNPRLTQGYGMTYWARLGWYGGNIHDGIDMTSENLSIRAPLSGRIVRGTTTCDSPSVAGVSNLKYAAIAHDGGIITVYLHIQ